MVPILRHPATLDIMRLAAVLTFEGAPLAPMEPMALA